MALPFKDAVDRAQAVNAEIIGDYKNASTKVRLQCQRCGHEWDQRISTLAFSRVGCPKCAIASNAASKRKSDEEIRAALDQLGIDYLDGYRNAHSPLRVRFRACGHVTESQRYSILIRGHGCSACYHVHDEDYKALAKSFGGELVRAGAATTKPSIWRCPNGCIFERSYASIRTGGTFCSFCSKGISERLCQVAFEQVFGIKFKKVKLADLRGTRGGVLEFDLYAEVGNQKIAVEHQGGHHYRPRVRNQSPEILKRQLTHDQKKREYALKNGIFLFEIPELFARTQLGQLKSVISAEALRLGCELPVGFDQLELDLSSAFRTSSAKQALEEIKALCDGLGYELLDDHYRGYAQLHAARCDKGHRFELRPSSFFSGSRCPECYEQSNWIPVLCSNGRVYRAANQAAADLGVDTGSVHSALRKGHFVGERLVKEITQEMFEALSNDSEALLHAAAELEIGGLNKRRHSTPLITSNGKIYSSQSDAARDFDCKTSQVSAALGRKLSTLHGVGVRQLTRAQYVRLKNHPDEIQTFVSKIWSSSPKRRQGKLKPIESSDGKRYESLNACALALGVSPSYVSTAIKNEKKIRGVVLTFAS